jgi:hypothetical protein
VLTHLLPTEEPEVRRAAQQSRWECEALFRGAVTLLEQAGAAAAAAMQEATDAG